MKSGKDHSSGLIANIRASAIEYIGDYYGSPDMSEENIIKELRARGPIVASIIVPIGLSLYKSGIIDCDNTYPTKLRDNEREEDILRRLRDNFLPVMHAIAIVGWGENENGEKYWICQNS